MDKNLEFSNFFFFCFADENYKKLKTREVYTFISYRFAKVSTCFLILYDHEKLSPASAPNKLKLGIPP